MRVWMIGCGTMASAMLARWLDAGVVRAGDVDVANRAGRTLPGNVRQARTLPDGPAPDAVVLGVKPQQVREAAAAHAARVADAPVLVSMLAGVAPETLAALFPGPVAVQTMPNLPVALGQGVTGVYAPAAGAATRTAVDRLLAPLGLVRWFDDAARFDAAGALSGCGPAFLFRFVDAMASAGAALGLAPDDAAAIALATVEGAAALAGRDARSPAALAEAVASPGGMTRAGLDVLDAGAALDTLLTRTLAASARRQAEMAAAARG
jgi:pyrroline-5-carboxylate reductase